MSGGVTSVGVKAFDGRVQNTQERDCCCALNGGSRFTVGRRSTRNGIDVGYSSRFQATLITDQATVTHPFRTGCQKTER